MSHLAKLVNATHILCSSKISAEGLEEANQLLLTFVDDFENLYGESQMVFNVHLLTHLTDCVKSIGPLCTYSNYHFEDQIGHLIGLHKGTTDVTSQISEKYLLEKNLFHYLSSSSIAREFYEEIETKHKYSIFREVENSIVMGKAKHHSMLTNEDKSLIVNTLNIPSNSLIEEYSSMLLNKNTFYRIDDRSIRTNDSFVFNKESNQFGVIESIFVINEVLYVLINENLEIVFDGSNESKFNISLKHLSVSRKKVIKSICIGAKFVLVKFDFTITCTKFPNMYERN